MFLVKVNSFTVFLMQVGCYWCVNRCDVRRYVGWKCIKLMEGYVVRFIVVLMNEYAYIEGEIVYIYRFECLDRCVCGFFG